MTIDYTIPELYLTPGTQSDLDTQHFNEINTQIEIEGNGLIDLAKIFAWKHRYFDSHDAGGESIGKVTVNEIMERKALSGCHDHGLVLASVLRRFGFPAVMVDAAGMQWALDYCEGTQEGFDFNGHVFVEIYVEGKWVLVCSTSGRYIEDYDPYDPVIPMTTPVESKGYFVLFKGLDPAGYGVTSLDALCERMEVFARDTRHMEVEWPRYTIRRLPHS